MDALREAAPLVRLMLALGEAKHAGELWIQRPSGRARVSLLDGQIVGVAGVEGEPLGDLLLARGELDLTRGLRPRAAGMERIGARLVAAGAASVPAVEQALRGQLVRRLVRLLRAPCMTVRLAPRLHDQGSTPWSVSAVAAGWGALWSLAMELPEPVLLRASGAGALAFTELGIRRLPGLTRVQLSGELETVLAALDVALPDGSLAQALAANPPRMLHALRATLRALDLVTRERAASAHRSDGYALLLRKRRELLRNESARTLLDLPGCAGPEQARRALRRLANKLHPDRYEACDTRLRALFGETMSALSRAEHALRTAT